MQINCPYGAMMPLTKNSEKWTKLLSLLYVMLSLFCRSEDFQLDSTLLK
jgi:hypothetical protein